VDTAYTNAITYADAGISAYQSDATKRLRGAEVFTPGWNVITESTITNRTYELSAGGLTVLTYEVILGGLTNENTEITATNVTFHVVTNNVVNKPFVEFTVDLETDEWQPVVETSNSYPAAEEYMVYGWVGTNYVATATNTGYTIVCNLPDDDASCFRVLNKTADSSMTVESDVIRFENLPTSTNGLPSAALWSDSGTLKVMP